MARVHGWKEPHGGGKKALVKGGEVRSSEIRSVNGQTLTQVAGGTQQIISVNPMALEWGENEFSWLV